MTRLAEDQRRRENRLLDEEIDRRAGVVFSSADVSWEARDQLTKLLKHYAKDPRPYGACVRDNMATFGPGRTEQVCGTIKEIVRATTRWNRSPKSVLASGEVPTLGDEAFALLMSMTDIDIDRITLEVQDHARS